MRVTSPPTGPPQRRRCGRSRIAPASRAFTGLRQRTTRGRCTTRPRSPRPSTTRPRQSPSRHPRRPTRHPHRPSRPSTSPRASRGQSCCCSTALAIGALAMLSLRGRKSGGRVPHRQTAAPQVYEPASGEAAVPAPPPAPASTAPMPAAVSAAAQDPTSSAAQIAELEAAVAMPAAGSPRNKEDHKTVDTPAPLDVDNSEPPEERVERVKALQRQLTWLGFHPGVVDGRYGPLTTEAVRGFQRVRGLPADGVADAATLTALRAGTPDRPFSGRVAARQGAPARAHPARVRARRHRRALRTADDRRGQAVPARPAPPR